MGSYCLGRSGRLSPGAFLVGADAALGAAAASRLPDHLSVVSLTIHMEFVRLRPDAAKDFLFQARVTHVGDDSVFADGKIVDDTGGLVAHMSTHCAFTRIDVPPSVTAGFPIDLSLLCLADGGDDSLAPIATARAGARLVDATEGEVRIAASPTPDMCNSRGGVQGGVLGLLAEQALTACLIRSTPEVAEADTADLNITYLRPVHPDRPRIEIVSRAEHASRRFASAHAVGYDNSGRAVISASGSRYCG